MEKEASLILALFVLFIAGLAKGFKDRSSENRFTKAWLNKNSWRNKWHTPLLKELNKPWYYLGLYKPRFKERFPYSSTALVVFTDGWHLFQFIQQWATWISIVLFVYSSVIGGIYLLASCSLSFYLGFNLAYEWITSYFMDKTVNENH